MYRIEDLDVNFKINDSINKPDAVFYDVLRPPFQLYGVFMENGKYRRMPEAVAREVSDGVYHLHTNTAGGRLRFCTDSAYVAVAARMTQIGKMPHFALTGSAGFDVYIKEEAQDRYAGTFRPPMHITNGFEDVVELGSRRMREITIHFPLYSDVVSLAVGLSKDSAVVKADPYRVAKPVVYYGSSITQGGCASRPGSAYPNIISRRLHCDHINLGFSGNAKAEDRIAAYISNMKMSLFVYDYDYNAPDEHYLADTHERMFQIIRAKNPTLPIILLSRPKIILNEREKEGLRIIERTYHNALNRGDRNVYFISGGDLMKYAGNDGTVDLCHPTDYGFASMARVLGDLMEMICF